MSIENSFNLFAYWRSSASYRVRIALNIKQVDYSIIPVHLINNGGEQHLSTYSAINPQELVPTLEHNHHTLSQSLAIIDYLEELIPTPELLPKNKLLRAKIRSLSHYIVADIHPITNLRVQQYLENILKISNTEKQQWIVYWLTEGLNTIEKLLQQRKNPTVFCYTNTVGLAECCLIPLVYNAERFQINIEKYPLIYSINKHCLELPEFYAASPKQQPDAIT